MGNIPLEIVFTSVKTTRGQGISRAEFFIDFYGHPREDELMTTARGDIYVRFGSNADRSSPGIQTYPFRLTTVDCEQFHEGLFVAGYGYSDQSRAIKFL
jgi:hypothetical protein